MEIIFINKGPGRIRALSSEGDCTALAQLVDGPDPFWLIYGYRGAGWLELVARTASFIRSVQDRPVRFWAENKQDAILACRWLWASISLCCGGEYLMNLE